MSSTWPFSVPTIPGVEGRIPYIWRQFVDPCDAPITVWMECAWPALLDCLICWYQIDLVQIFRNYVKPPLMGMRARGGGHWGGGRAPPKRRGKWGRLNPFAFDPNDVVGKALNPYSVEEMVMLLPGEVFFWTGFEAVLLFELEWQVFDIVTRFFYEWTSGVAKTRYCHARDDAVLLAQAPGYPLIGIFGWDAVGILDVVKMRNITFFNGFGAAQLVSNGVVGCTFQFENTGGGSGPPWIESRMTCLTGPRQGSYHARRIDTGAGNTGTGGVTYDMAAGEVWIGEIRVNGSYQIIDPQLFVHARFSGP